MILIMKTENIINDIKNLEDLFDFSNYLFDSKIMNYLVRKTRN